MPGILGRREDRPGHDAFPILSLAREAGAAGLEERPSAEVQQAAWPAPRVETGTRHAMLLGGAGVARLAVGQGTDALDLELRGLGNYGTGHSHRLTLRLAIGGRAVLGDLDGQARSGRGFERATVSHNTVAVDGLNQRESLDQSRRPTPGSEIRFFAADPDFQVATFDDRYAYPTSTTLYRQTVVACSGERSRYALSVFEVRGGLQHDEFFHAPAGSANRWRISARTAPGPASLLPASIPFVPTAEAEDGPLVRPVVRGILRPFLGPPRSSLAGDPGGRSIAGRPLAPAGRRPVLGGPRRHSRSDLPDFGQPLGTLRSRRIGAAATVR